jgi:hypothetical protein
VEIGHPLPGYLPLPGSTGRGTRAPIADQRPLPNPLGTPDEKGLTEHVYQGELVEGGKPGREEQPLDYGELIREARLNAARAGPDGRSRTPPPQAPENVQRAITAYRDAATAGGPELMQRVDDFA